MEFKPEKWSKCKLVRIVNCRIYKIEINPKCQLTV